MGRRLSTGTDPYGPIADKRYEHDPRIMDHIKISGTFRKQLLLVSEYVRVDGPRILELLGSSRDGSDPPEWDHPVAGDDRQELRELLQELMAGIEEYLDFDEDILERAGEVGPNDTMEIEATEPVFLYVYRRCWAIERLLAFCIEQDIDLAIQ